MDRAWRLTAMLFPVLCGCATEKSSSIEVVARDCRIALPYVKSEIGECTARSAAAYDFAFCHLHFVVAVLAAPPADRAQGEAGLSAEFRRKAIAYGKVSQALDGAGFRRNVDLAKRYFESLQKQNPMVANSSLEYVRAKCDSLGSHHAGVLQSLRGDERL